MIDPLVLLVFLQLTIELSRATVEVAEPPPNSTASARMIGYAVNHLRQASAISKFLGFWIDEVLLSHELYLLQKYAA